MKSCEILEKYYYSIRRMRNIESSANRFREEKEFRKSITACARSPAHACGKVFTLSLPKKVVFSFLIPLVRYVFEFSHRSLFSFYCSLPFSFEYHSKHTNSRLT
uniref:(northern house mosquito) hypothetical protein n=1 Tax=Culex pipiens TaxID=7175 RepID=A0A8D8BGJ3_CULPI